jgi:hypothetical protein
MGKTQAATEKGIVESSTQADRVESDTRGEKEGGGLRKGKERDSRRHKVACMLVTLRMKRAAAGVYRKIILIRINLCINIHFLNFNLNIRYILSAYWIRDTTLARHISLI